MSENNQSEGLEYNEEPEVVTVDQFEWEIVEGGIIGETTGMGPCFGVIIYDPETKKAIVGHFPKPSMSHEFEDMIMQAKKTFNDIKKVDVYLGGGGPSSISKRDIEDCKKDRKFVKRTFEENGFENLKINYNDSLADNTILRINTENGKVDYDTTEDLEDEKD